MKFSVTVLMGIVLLFIAAPLTAGEAIIYGGSQKPGKISFPTPSGYIDDLKGDFGSTFGIRYSAGRVIGFEETIGFSPRFAKPGVRAFQMDSNLVIQSPGKIAPYVTVGIGFIRTWGSDNDPIDLDDPQLDPEKIAGFAFSFGTNFALNYGGGLKIRRIAGPLGINFDVRGYRLPNVRDNDLKFIQTTLGAVITW